MKKEHKILLIAFNLSTGASTAFNQEVETVKSKGPS